MIENQFWIAFAFSDWNAANYAAGEFRDPGREMSRAMMTGLPVVDVLRDIGDGGNIRTLGTEGI